MPEEWSAVGWAALVVVGMALMVSLLLTVLARFAIMARLARLVRLVRARRVPPEAAFPLFMRRLRRVVNIGIFAMIVLLVFFLARDFFALYIFFYLPAWISPQFPTGVVAGLTALAAFVWFATPVLFLGATSASDAYATVRGVRGQPGGIWGTYAKITLARYLPALALLEGAAALVVLGQSDLLWVIPVVAGLTVLLRAYFAPYEQRWIVRSTPIEQTSWAALEERAQAWAKRAGVRLGPIRLLYTGALATAAASAQGLWRPTIFLGDNLLAATDWRQQDALVATLLGLARRRGEYLVAKMVWAVVEAAILAGIFAIFALLDATR